MKKALAIVLSLVLCLSFFAGCGADNSTPADNSGAAGSTRVPTTISVVSSYGGDDGNRQAFVDALDAYMAKTGDTIEESSGTANEDWKAQVHASYEAGAEPDVLFFFNGVDSDPLVKSNKLVSIDEIKAVYPDYASNMDMGRVAVSGVDGKAYFLPVNGYWESMFANTKVLGEAGVTTPGADYTWDQFKADCQKVLDAGYTPIACSLQEVPHYWFEFVVLNHTSPANHLTIPAAGSDAEKAWVAGLNDIKELYDLGFFPSNTLTAGDAETFQIMFDGEAAFAIDGSWKTGAFVENCPDTLDDYTVVYPPSNGDARKASDLIGGISMGYAISRKAWDDESKRDALVDFVSYMTSDDVVSVFCGAVGSNALKNGSTAATANSLEEKVVKMISGATSFTGAVQDAIPGEWKTNLFQNIKLVCTGEMTAEDAMAAMYESQAE